MTLAPSLRNSFALVRPRPPAPPVMRRGANAILYGAPL
jgi:hypothetical protein